VRYYVRQETWERIKRHVRPTPRAPSTGDAAATDVSGYRSGLKLGENLHVLGSNKEIERIPDCYLGHRGGLYSLGPVSNPQLQGNRISRALAESYRKYLRSAEEASRAIVDPDQQGDGDGEPRVGDAPDA
jgi:hypothetical protein